MLNFDGDVDGDANVKCEQSIKVSSHLTFAFAFASMSLLKFNIASMVMQTQKQNGSEPILCININLMVMLTERQTQMQTSSVNKA